MDLSTAADFPSLSIQTLLEARALYHWHFMHKNNVIATAVGRYLIRDDDPWPDSRHPRPPRPRAGREGTRRGRAD